ncbi:hypothetical protein [Sphingomonas jatrophae]|uniref:Uncharacterized protein n=1 Tax=Sphingomonas jatrophae TaxID=1166337 RepID=A0A1I6JRK9_9SPHN|nr:hypothetical protein [Sphingomonas jatrophae]SFR81609.1 hypothetical protein SAMN05192580_0731 [Sphingomonas jatrophae]
MAKTQTISTAKTIKDVDKALASATKAVSMLGIKIAFRKPDMNKLALAMKDDEEAEVQLIEDGPNIKVAIAAGNYKSVLGIHNVLAEKDLEKLAATLRSLQKQGFGSFKKELAEVEKKLKGPDQKVVDKLDKEAGALRKVIAALQAERAAMAKMGFQDIMKDSKRKKEFEAHLKKEMAFESVEFLRDINKDAEYLKKTYIGDKATNQININSATVKKIMAGAHPKIAGPEIIKLLDGDNVPRYRKSVTDALDATMKAKQVDLDKLNKALGQALNS